VINIREVCVTQRSISPWPMPRAECHRSREQPRLRRPRRFLQLGKDFIQVETGGLLPLRESTERGQELAYVILGWHQKEGVVK